MQRGSQEAGLWSRREPAEKWAVNSCQFEFRFHGIC